jgi:alcohol dehydrogenase class IV
MPLNTITFILKIRVGDRVMEFKFATASRIIFGCGKHHQIGEFASEFGERALLVTGSEPGRLEEVLFSLDSVNIVYETFRIVSEPTIEAILEGIDQAKAFGCEMVVAIGGGSVMDGGKAIAALLVNEGDPLDYLEVIGKGEPLVHPSKPIIAVPTTAGTGSEVTRNAVLASKEHKVKVSLRSPTMLPRIALVDPELTCSLPPNLTASTGMDALTQVLEPYVSKMSNSFVDILCREGMRLATRSLEKAYENGHNLAAREDMAFTSLLGGMALANAKLGAVHGFAGSLGGMIPAPHGAICARLLPYVMEMNIRALMSRTPDCPALGRYHEIGVILTGRESATMMDGVDWVIDLCEKFKIRPLRDFGLDKGQFPEVVGKASRSSSMKGNPIILTERELEEILIKAF